MGVYQGVVDIEGESLVDILDGYPRQQGGTLASVPHGVALGHGIAHRHLEEQHSLAVGGVAQDNLGLGLIEGAQKALLLPDGHRLAVDDIRLSLGVVQGQIGEIPGDPVGLQGHDGHLVELINGAGGHRQGDPLHLGQLDLHQGIEMPLELGVHLLHIEVGHLGHGLVAFLHHHSGQPDEHRHAQGGQTQKADPQKADGLVFLHWMRLPLPPGRHMVVPIIQQMDEK